MKFGFGIIRWNLIPKRNVLSCQLLKFWRVSVYEHLRKFFNMHTTSNVFLVIVVKTPSCTVWTTSASPATWWAAKAAKPWRSWAVPRRVRVGWGWSPSGWETPFARGTSSGVGRPSRGTRGSPSRGWGSGLGEAGGTGGTSGGVTRTLPGVRSGSGRERGWVWEWAGMSDGGPWWSSGTGRSAGGKGAWRTGVVLPGCVRGSLRQPLVGETSPGKGRTLRRMAMPLPCVVSCLSFFGSETTPVTNENTV